MKIKLLFLLIGSSLLTYLIFQNYQNNKLVITSIYDRSTIVSENYNNLLKNNNDKINITLNDFSQENFEIENVIQKIKENKKSIQTKIHSSNVVIIYLGEFELVYEKAKLNDIYNELEILFKTIRSLNQKQIIFLSPYSLQSTYLFKELSSKYKIEYINLKKVLNNEDFNDKNSQIKIGNAINEKIWTAWKFDN